jgi:hypothetical protein
MLSSFRVSTLMAVAVPAQHRSRRLAAVKGVAPRRSCSNAGFVLAATGAPARECPWTGRNRRPAPAFELPRDQALDLLHEAEGLGAGGLAGLPREPLADVVDHQRQHVHGAQHQIDLGLSNLDAAGAGEIEQVLDLVGRPARPTRCRAPDALPFTV